MKVREARPGVCAPLSAMFAVTARQTITQGRPKLNKRSRYLLHTWCCAFTDGGVWAISGFPSHLRRALNHSGSINYTNTPLAVSLHASVPDPGLTG